LGLWKIIHPDRMKICFCFLVGKWREWERKRGKGNKLTRRNHARKIKLNRGEWDNKAIGVFTTPMLEWKVK